MVFWGYSPPSKGCAAIPKKALADVDQIRTRHIIKGKKILCMPQTHFFGVCPPGAANPGGRHAKDFFLNLFCMKNKRMICMELVCSMFDEWVKKNPANESVLRSEPDSLILLTPVPFIETLINEVMEMNNGSYQDFSIVSSALRFPFVFKVDGVVVKINSVICLPSFDMTLHLYHTEISMNLDDSQRVSIPLMPGFEVGRGIDGAAAVMFKIGRAFPEMKVGQIMQQQLN